MLIHSVYFWFKPDADATLTARFADGLARLTKIPDIQTAHFGRPEVTPKRPVIDDTYAWALVETFADIEAHDRYQSHPIHQEFVNEFAATWQKVQVYDVRTGMSGS
ncbi:MAG TPA: Dabb family protein [Polyangiaceae bacterium]|nr:Dabb family protein [Polyangiaceae bacterium]